MLVWLLNFEWTMMNVKNEKDPTRKKVKKLKLHCLYPILIKQKSLFVQLISSDNSHTTQHEISIHCPPCNSSVGKRICTTKSGRCYESFFSGGMERLVFFKLQIAFLSLSRTTNFQPFQTYLPRNLSSLLCVSAQLCPCLNCLHQAYKMFRHQSLQACKWR